MSEPRQYMLMEVVGDGPKFKEKYDSWLCLFIWRHAFLDSVLDRVDPNVGITVKFTFLEMTDDEHAAYCEEHGIEWE